MNQTTHTPPETELAHTVQVPVQYQLTLMSHQPVSVAIEADSYVFQLYSTGVITGSSCGTQLDHGVTAVGYGTEGSNDYFLVRNSWGASWGDQGYVKIGASSDNVCGILSQPSFPTA